MTSLIEFLGMVAFIAFWAAVALAVDWWDEHRP